MTSLPGAPVIVAPTPGVPDWAAAEWRQTAPVLVAHLKPQGPVTLSARFAPAVPGQLNVLAEAQGGRIEVALEGDGWAEPTEKGRAILRQNLAHELAHLAHPATRSTPLWWHEGMAEALARDALVEAGLWTGTDISAHRVAAAQDCAAALAKPGPLDRQFAARDRAAVYGCGFVLVDAVAEASGERAAALHARFDGTEADMSDVIAAAASVDMARSVEAFLARDTGGVRGDITIRALRAGRL